MPYIFSALIVANLLMLGYFMTKTDSDTNQAQAKVQLQSPVSFKNNSQRLPPEIGKK